MRQFDSVTFNESIKLPKCPACYGSPIISKINDEPFWATITAENGMIVIPLDCSKCGYGYSIHLYFGKSETIGMEG